MVKASEAILMSIGLAEHTTKQVMYFKEKQGLQA